MIVKDPNKPVIRLYDIPDNTFESEESGEEEDDELDGNKLERFDTEKYFCLVETNVLRHDIKIGLW